MKVYTKTGDKGTTALISGKRVPKYHKRIEAYGTVDELMAFTAVVHDQLFDASDKSTLIEIQDRLMTCATILAADCDDCEFKIPKIVESDIEKLELLIDEYEKKLPRLVNFVLPGGHATISFCHVARTVCRRAERLALIVHEEEGNCEMVVKYLNRLSDYFFILSRKLTLELKINEIPWIPRQ
ncbi:MAG: cob(I)yrinic acid a,c-diamide adenosyltransferase [Salinivirgaceae bacterium]|nr:cob(I)yrinic acid a,c-diamide adenosyltransferase [Salinivirgaceae bacterium]